MGNLTPVQLHSIISNSNISSQLRDDGKIVFHDKSIDGFKDADGDDGVLFIVSIPFPNFVYVHASSVFDGSRAANDPIFLASLNDFIAHSLVGSYELNDDGSRISWSAGIYHNQDNNDLQENIMGIIINFLEHVKRLNDLEDSAKVNEDLSVEISSLEDIFQSESNLSCHPLELIDDSRDAIQKDKELSCDITLSDNLNSQVRQEIESRIKDIVKYLTKNEFSLPAGFSLRIQHGNNAKDVESGFNKGPYLCIIDSNGNEKKNMKLFMSRRGNLNSFIAVSTLLSRL